MKVGTVLGIAAACLTAAPLAAQQPRLQLSGGITTVGQWADDERIQPEVVASLDLFADLRLGRATLHIYTEANTTPRVDGVSRLVGEANTDAGTALSRRRRGRVQISEARVVWPVSGSINAHGGLLDATGFLDVSRIANDENLFFLGVPFVNNPTIEFPDYALGAALQGEVPGTDALRFAVVATSSHGLSDNPNVSYAQVFDVAETGKGLFAGATLRWVSEGRRVALGGWVNSAEHPRLASTDVTEPNAGLFSVVGWSFGEHALSARAGLSNGDVSPAHAFLGATYLWVRRPNALGLALGRTLASDALPELANVGHAEVFARRRLVGEVFVTASVQHIHNSDFDASGDRVDRRLWIAGLRLSAVF